MIAHIIDAAGVAYIAALALAVYRIGRARRERRHAQRAAGTSRLSVDARGAYPSNHKRGAR